jgi:hypothetical protein
MLEVSGALAENSGEYEVDADMRWVLRERYRVEA